jgi:hypothetical protein
MFLPLPGRRTKMPLFAQTKGYCFNFSQYKINKHLTNNEIHKIIFHVFPIHNKSKNVILFFNKLVTFTEITSGFRSTRVPFPQFHWG